MSLCPLKCSLASQSRLAALRVSRRFQPRLPSARRSSFGLLRGFKRIKPTIHLKCFTAVEIAFFADTYGKTDEAVLRDLIDAGLDSLPGGGAEVFAERVRRKICHDKCGTDRWLDIHRRSHRLGLRSNVTMLYGHIETLEERVDHMLRARALLSLKLAVLALELMDVKGAAQNDVELVNLDRLVEVVVGAEADRAQRVLSLTLARNDDHLRAALLLQDLVQNEKAFFDTVRIGRKAQIERDERHAVLFV